MADIATLLDRDELAISAPLDCTLWPDKGPQPTFFASTLTSPACPSLVDCYGRLKDALPGEALFYGARRVENLLRYSEHLSFTGAGGWFLTANATVTPVTDSRRPGSAGNMSVWKVSRAALTNSVIRQNAGIRRFVRPPGLDLLQPLPHLAAVNIRRATTNAVSTAELRIYTTGGPTITTKTVSIGDALQTFAISFTPAAPKRIAALSWASNTITVTIPAHGYANGSTIRLSGSLPNGFDVEGMITVVDANTFTVVQTVNPGVATSFGWAQPAYFFGIAPDSFGASGFGDVEIEFPYVSEIEGYPAGAVCEYVPRSRIPSDKYWYGANVDGVRYYNTAPGLRLDATTGLVTGGAGPRLSTTRGLAVYAQTQSLIPRKLAEYLSGWAKSDPSVALLDNADATPLGTPEASRIVEGTVTGRQYAELPSGFLTAANTTSSILSTITAFLATPGGTAGRDWACLSFVDRAGTEQNAWVNLVTGATGAATSGVRNVHMEPLAVISGLSFWRVHLEVNNGTGSSAPILRIGLADANNSNSYAGSGTRYVVCWGVAYCGGTLVRPTAAPYGRAHQEINPTLGGAALQYDTRGVLGTGNIAASVVFTPYYKPQQLDKFDYSAVIYFRCDAPQFVSSATATIPIPVPMDRFGFTVRPNNFPGTDAGKNWAFDLYNGDPNALYMFKTGGYYHIGDIVIPTDTLPNNDNARPMFTVISVNGPAASEPAWPTVTTLPSGTVTSGGVTFQCIHDNGINGFWEPYNGCLVLPPNEFMAEIRSALFIGENDYGVAINGKIGFKQTEPQPINTIYKYKMRFPIRLVLLGNIGSPLGDDLQSITPYIGIDGSALLPRQTSFVKDLFIWNKELSQADLVQITT